MSDDEMYDEFSSGEGSVRSDDDEDMIDGTQESNSDSSPDDGEMSDDDDYNFDADLSVMKGKARQRGFDVEAESLSVQDIEAIMKRDAEHVSGIFGAPVSIAYLLLRYQTWNKEKLIERYMDDPSKVLATAGVLDPSTENLASPIMPPSSRRVTRGTTSTRSRQSQPSLPPFMCPICCDDEPPNIMSLGCGHMYCSNCWDTYLHTKIREEGELSIRCMDELCAIQADQTFIRKVVSNQDLQRYHELLVRDYVTNNPQLRFCPHPGCSHAISCAAASTKSALQTIVPTVRCVDKHAFCFGCALEGGHAPVICNVSKLWLKKCADDSETANWIKSNTKECTNCNSTIEKNGGCNHMTCKKCKNEFCWVCMGSWAEHGTSWYSCNRYDEKDGVDARDIQSKSRASLERYLHYYNRWANHEQSARLSLDLYAKTEKKMEEMQITSNLTWIEVQFAKKAVDEVIKCRKTLKWTYAMAFYLESGNAKQLFEDNQADLEKAVEDLSELLESPIEPETIPKLRQKMTDKTVYVAKRNDIVLEDTAKGFVDERWIWNIGM